MIIDCFKRRKRIFQSINNTFQNHYNKYINGWHLQHLRNIQRNLLNKLVKFLKSWNDEGISNCLVERKNEVLCSFHSVIYNTYLNTLLSVLINVTITFLTFFSFTQDTHLWNFYHLKLLLFFTFFLLFMRFLTLTS